MPARRLALTGIALIVILLGSILGVGVTQNGWQAQPKLALDLEGGTQVILQASSRTGEPISAEQMDQARQIMAQRINALGVAETEISVQGGTNIVVNVPGEIDERTSEALRRTATMSFRPVLYEGAPEATASDAGGASDGVLQDPSAFGPVVTSGAQEGQSAEASDGGSSGAVPADGPLAWSAERLTPQVEAEFAALNCTDPQVLQDHDVNSRPTDTVVACAPGGAAKYVLGPEVVTGENVADASVSPESTPAGQATGFYVVNLEFDAAAGETFGTMSQALYSGDGATRQFAIVLDSLVISAPVVESPTSTRSSINGNFTAERAQELASQLKFGALPLEFSVQSEQQISATLGSDQLRNGLIAGLIGLILVMAYAALQYRVLSIVTITSLILMGGLAYAIITIMSNLPDVNYRLSLAGVAGLIVAIAFTADSFIVYFERVRDEIREGRGIVGAVDHGWDRAKRTILASDAVNLIAAIVLYLVSAGSVRGFAFTLGLTTLLDLIVVFLFTHPLLQSLVRTNFFGKGHPLSGLDPAQLGRNVPAYAGRARFRSESERRGPLPLPRRSSSPSAAPAETLAERKAREAREAREADQRRQEPGSPPSGPVQSAGEDN
ncbi:MAG: protein translocase subunit SecD [Dermabacter sp.]|nr:protein translocase subunit SecD [Dermabacter sp.]